MRKLLPHPIPSPYSLHRACQAFVNYLYFLNTHFVCVGVELGAADFAGPGPFELPGSNWGAHLVHHDDRAIGASVVYLALFHLFAPLPGFHRVGNTALEVDLLPLQATRYG